ncbi:acyl carrier protein [Pseudonocardia alaniniphila]|uniref:acyl carrier protein n=1 Tax=Pseudonocardia alaniniphila TaxID=75291 RepID=UPI00363947DE
MRECAAAVLDSADLPAADSTFGSHGMDSVTAVRLRNILPEAVGMLLPATLLFNFPTPIT